MIHCPGRPNSETQVLQIILDFPPLVITTWEGRSCTISKLATHIINNNSDTTWRQHRFVTELGVTEPFNMAEKRTDSVVGV